MSIVQTPVHSKNSCPYLGLRIGYPLKQDLSFQPRTIGPYTRTWIVTRNPDYRTMEGKNFLICVVGPSSRTKHVCLHVLDKNSYGGPTSTGMGSPVGHGLWTDYQFRHLPDGSEEEMLQVRFPIKSAIALDKLGQDCLPDRPGVVAVLGMLLCAFNALKLMLQGPCCLRTPINAH
jgi:hypothetical protein